MAATGTLSRDALWSYELSTYPRAATLSESRLGRITAGDDERSLIQSPESGENDFSILMDSQYPEGCQGDALRKFVQLLDTTSEGFKPIVGTRFLHARLSDQEWKCTIPRSSPSISLKPAL